MKQLRRRYAGTVKVGEKGQIVIPKEVREIFSIQPGDNLLILADLRRGIGILRDETVFDKMQDALPLGDPEEGEGQ